MSALPVPSELTGEAVAPRPSPAEITHPARFYRPELDVLRFFAFLCVFLHHGMSGFEPSQRAGTLARLEKIGVALKDAGAFGVCLFFVLSAYLITELLDREHKRTGTVEVGWFYLRRVLRIWPLYFTFLFFAFGLGTIVPSYRVEAGRIWAFVFLVGNWYVAAVGCNISPMGPLWSISLEEQFYLAWPWMARIGGRTLIASISLALFPVSWVVLFVLAHRGTNAENAIWVNSFVQFQFFGVGALLALALKQRTPDWRLPARIGLVAGAMVCWLVAAGTLHIKRAAPPPSAAALICGYLLVAFGCALIFLATVGIRQRFSPRLIMLGKISYGLYVFHVLGQHAVLHVLRGSVASTRGSFNVIGPLALQAAALCITILLATLSYYFLERPFLKMKERFTVIRSRAA